MDNRKVLVGKNHPVIYFSGVLDPHVFPKVRAITIKPRWLMTAVLWVFRKLGFQVHDLRDPNHPTKRTVQDSGDKND